MARERELAIFQKIEYRGGNKVLISLSFWEGTQDGQLSLPGHLPRKLAIFPLEGPDSSVPNPILMLVWPSPTRLI